MKQTNKQNRGITLIALIITIIILLILVGITLDVAIDGKLIDNAGKSVSQANDKLEQEDEQRNEALSNWLNENGSGTKGGTQENIGVCIFHSYGEWIVTKEATCTETGTKERVCTKCGYTHTEVIPSGHKFVDGVCTECGEKEFTNTIPTIASIEFSSKTTSSFTINALATDVDGENLTYYLYITGESEPKETKQSAQGISVTLTAGGLDMYTDYTYYVVVADSEEGVQSSTATVKTKCSGITDQCTTSSCTGKTTRTCSKTETYTCPGPTEEDCWGGCDSGKVTCTGSIQGTSNGTSGTCDGCGHFYTLWDFKCSTCGTNYGEYCRSCEASMSKTCDAMVACTTCWGDGIVTTDCTHGSSYTTSHSATRTCTTCDGTGTVTSSPCTHTQYSSHRYCTHYPTTTTKTTHYYCDHGFELGEHE